MNEIQQRVNAQELLVKAISDVALPFMDMLVINTDEQKLHELKVAIDVYLYIFNLPVSDNQQVLKFDSAPSSSTTTQPNDITETN